MAVLTFRVADPYASLFERCNVEQQAKIFEDYVLGTLCGRSMRPFESIAATVKRTGWVTVPARLGLYCVAMTKEIATLEHAATDPGSSVLEPLRRRLVRRIEKLGGRHDEQAIYGGQPGDLGLTGGPSSMSWELNGDLASLGISGVGAVLMEVLHPSVMAGVFTQSSYRTEPLRRSRNTLGYVLRTTFGNTAAATQVIENVRRIHGRVHGVTPDGVAYSALDPELIAWVHTCIPWAIMTAYDRYARPLSTDEKNRYLREQAVIGRMGGADWVPETVAELETYIETMRPRMQVNAQTRSFIAFLMGRGPEIPTHWLERFDRFVALYSSMSLMPEWARELTGINAPALVRHSVLHARNRARARLVRWAYPELPCKRLALARANTHTPTSSTNGPHSSLGVEPSAPGSARRPM